MSKPVVRRRVPKSQRRRDGLIQFARDVTSQNGEDGIIEEIFQVIPRNDKSRICVDVGAWDGRHLSNTFSLLTSKIEKWHGILIEADKEKFQELSELHKPLGNVCINATVSSNQESEDSLVTLLQNQASHIPKNFDFLCIDIDGTDYWLLHDMWKFGFRPKLVCIEANPTMPNDLVYIPARNDTVRHGASLAALVELALENDYVLIETTIYNAFFVPKTLYEGYFQQLVPDTSIEALHEMTMGTSIYQLYDGTLKLWGCKKMLWHRLPMSEKKIQMLPPEQRNFPFAPQMNEKNNPDTTVVDMSPYCCKSKSIEKNDKALICSKAIVDQLKLDGFVLVRGTGISREICEEALSRTHDFLQDADESVRRSCLTKDRARRGYSPMCTENFASLIGEQGPNDLVRKFRMGPTVITADPKQQQNQQQQIPESSLLNPNVWPSSESWDGESCQAFQAAVETYYGHICTVAHAIVRAICDGILQEKPELSSSLNAISRKDIIDHTSILTLLGYRKGTRHKKTQKKRHIHPLVAAHTGKLLSLHSSSFLLCVFCFPV